MALFVTHTQRKREIGSILMETQVTRVAHTLISSSIQTPPTLESIRIDRIILYRLLAAY